MSDNEPSIILIGVLLVFVLIAPMLLIAYFNTPHSVTTKVDVYNLGSDLGVEGHFVLGSGSVNSEPVYVYFIRKDTGAYAMKYISADQTDLFMDENDNPYLISDWSCIGSEDRNVEQNCYLSHAEFHVPNGTLIRAYTVGAK